MKRLGNILLVLGLIVGVGSMSNSVFANTNSSKNHVAEHKAKHALVLLTDFGLKDTAVASMKGVAFAVNPNLHIFDATHEIPPFSIWDASYRLRQTIGYWPPGTVFVSVVDPGVGTERISVVAKLKTGQYVVTPDNGTLTLLDDSFGISEVRVIDETKNRLKGSEKSYTFHGRDVYVYTGAKLAAGDISFAEVGPIQTKPITKLAYTQASYKDGTITGTIDALDLNYGNVWTNINDALLEKHNFKIGTKYQVTIKEGNKVVYSEIVPYVSTFGAVELNQPLLYVNSNLDLSIALNWNNFAALNKISYGPEWSLSVSKIK